MTVKQLNPPLNRAATRHAGYNREGCSRGTSSVHGAWVAVAGAGAGLALAGAALTGNLGSSTTIEQVTTPTAAASKLARPVTGLIRPGDLPPRRSRRRAHQRTPAPRLRPPSARLRLRDRQGRPHRHEQPRRLRRPGTQDQLLRQRRARRLDRRQRPRHRRRRPPDRRPLTLAQPAPARRLRPRPGRRSRSSRSATRASLDRTATVGIVSGVQHGIDTAAPAAGGHAIQTDAPSTTPAPAARSSTPSAR